MSNELKRYGPWIDCEPNGEDAFARMSEEDNGDYVLHSDALAAIEAAKPKWLPIESAPKDGTPVDLWRANWGERVTNMRRVELSPENVFYEAVESGPTCVRDATHYMLISPPPESEPVK